MGDIQLYEVSTSAELETAVHDYGQRNPNLPWLRGQGLRSVLPWNGGTVRGTRGDSGQVHCQAVRPGY